MRRSVVKYMFLDFLKMAESQPWSKRRRLLFGKKKQVAAVECLGRVKYINIKAGHAKIEIKFQRSSILVVTLLLNTIQFCIN